MENNFKIVGSDKNVLAAVYKAKGELGSTIYAGGTNPHFGNDFIQFHALAKKIDPVCQKYGLCIMQFPTGEGLVTLLFHEESGESIISYYELKLDKQTSQGIGSALSYAKRQIYQAMFGLSAGFEDPSDDDAEKATEEENQFESQNPVQGKLTSSSAFQISKVALQEINSLEDLERWKKVQPETVRDNEKVRELVKAKTAELKMAA
jgi:hypothetical protein